MSSLLQLIPAALCVIAAGLIYRQTLSHGGMSGWRRHAAASIPAAYTFLLLLAWVLPIQFFLVSTLTVRSRLPVLILTLLGVVLGACLPAGHFRLRRAEAGGRIYAALGVRRFRSLVTYGDPMVRLMRRIAPESYGQLQYATLAERERRTRKTERIHSAMLLSSLPTATWAVLADAPWFAAYLLAANIPMNVYPIMLQRYTRARLGRILGHTRYRAREKAA